MAIPIGGTVVPPFSRVDMGKTSHATDSVSITTINVTVMTYRVSVMTDTLTLVTVKS
jgi:hypothetical protein